jgi:hypothetical protein
MSRMMSTRVPMPMYMGFLLAGMVVAGNDVPGGTWG